MPLNRSARWLLVLTLILLLLIALIATLTLLHWRQSQVSQMSASGGAGTPNAAPSQPLGVPVDANDPAGLPVGARSLQVLHKEHYTIGYDPQQHEPAWVSYALAGGFRFHGREKRPDRFLPDAEVRSPPHHEDYSRSGFDRGHMCPAYAMFSRYGPTAMEQTFITTNICPQIHALNAGRWEDLEALIAGREESERGHVHRDPRPVVAALTALPSHVEPVTPLVREGGWAAAFGQVWVTDGPVLQGSPGSLRGGERIPSAFFMIVLRQDKDGHFRSLAVEMPNEAIDGPIEHYLVSIRTIEQQTGMTFLAGLPSDQQEALKAEAASRLW